MNSGETEASRPNLLYIHSDQHGPSVTGCYGDPLVQTPNLDGLAAKGTVFTNAYCPSPVCVPSRMSMLTGRYPYENEVWANNHVLDSGIPTFAHAMGAAGYRPVLINRSKPPALPGDSKSLTVPGIFENLPIVNRAKLTEREVLDEQHTESKTYPLGLQVSFGVDSEMSEESVVWSVAQVSGRSFA